jgi:glycosyltransferase involved in cell wall biosynthesis
MDKTVPLVSIVMPCFNAEQHLARSVGSVLAQSFREWELIAVNDGSTDSTLEWLHGQSDARIHVISQVNMGLSSARNSGLAAARSPYVAFLDADDTWHPAFLEEMFNALATRPDAVLAYCGWQNVGLAKGRGKPFVPPDYEGTDKLETLLSECRWPVHAALVKLAPVRGVGGFDRSLKSCEDFALWVRLALAAPIVRVPKVLAYYHFHGGNQLSKNLVQIALSHWKAQNDYLREHPEIVCMLGRPRLRALTLGSLLARGYAAYWQRDLRTARVIFREVMRHLYGRPGDWKYMIPAWLPESWHRRVLAIRDRNTQGTHGEGDDH